MTDKQKLFADYYIETGNATESYKRAFNPPSIKTAIGAASKTLKKPDIQKYLSKKGYTKKGKGQLVLMPEVEEKEITPSITPAIFRAMVRGYSVKALETIVKILDSSAAKPSDQLKAAEMILDRAIGKPSQDTGYMDDNDLTWLDEIPEDELKTPEGADIVKHWHELEAKYKNA